MKSIKLHELYKPSLALLTDMYQLSMAYGYWKSGRHLDQAVFQMFFRKIPFSGGFAVAAGLESLVDFIENFSWNECDLDYIRSIVGVDGKALVSSDFIDYLRQSPLNVSIDAVEEGRVVFANEPLVRVTGPLLQCQILETAILNLINFPTLIATKAARVCVAAKGDRVLEFGVRRAQGIDGGLTASRACFIGGVAATSNLLAGSLYGIPVSGTHAHSWVMSFDSEEEAFLNFAKAMPGNSVFLVDTYNSLIGVDRAIKIGQSLKENGNVFSGIRLDSGDLAYLSIEARKKLDAAGFFDATIVGSNDLDEHQITDLKSAGARINVWGVGTKLVTGHESAALGGVYKLVALRGRDAKEWAYKLKLSDEITKITTPGIQQIRRFRNGDEFIGDMVFDEMSPPIHGDKTIVDPSDPTRRKKIDQSSEFDDLLVPIFRDGKCVYKVDGLMAARQRCRDDLKMLHESVKRIKLPHDYPAGLELSLYEMKSRMIKELKGF